MPLYPYYPNARANGAHDDLPDWASSDYADFEKAVEGGASRYRPVAPWGGQLIKTAGKKEPSVIENAKKYAIDNLGVPPEKVNEVARYGLGYAFRDRDGAKILWGMTKNRPGTITRAQEAELQDVFRDPLNRNAAAMREKYNELIAELIASGKLRLVP